MVKLFKAMALLLTLALATPESISASESNNKFGIHIIDENDLADAAALVNSGGGEWGYVTFVIREDERDSYRWQKAFDQMRRLKLIPIVRLATKMNNSHWEIPKNEEAVNWAGFLNSLNWPIKNRYVILFNEPNHAKEWGESIDPAGYARVSAHYYETLKNFSSDFFILPAALDLAAPNGNQTMEASQYFSKMHEENNFIFTIFDGLNSHSYPNPGFSGSPEDSGKLSIRGFEWELSYLKNFGMKEDIPVFITETGWITGENVSKNYLKAYKDVWVSKQIVAITPFLLSYLDKPFDIFSWKNPGTKDFLPHYYSVQSIAKPKGKPPQRSSFEALSSNFPERLFSDSEYSFLVKLKNTGQSIWTAEDGFLLRAESTLGESSIRTAQITATEPGQTTEIPVRIKTFKPRGIHTIKFLFYKDETLIGEVMETQFVLVSPPNVNIHARFWFGEKDNTASVLLYDDGNLITKFDNLNFIDGKVTLPPLEEVIPNKIYKFVILKPFYSSGVAMARVYAGQNDVNFKRLIPFDLNSDGFINLKDLATHLQNPLSSQVQILPFQ